MNQRQPKGPHRIGGRMLGEGKWIFLEEIDYMDRNGCPRTWEASARQGGQEAVVIVARLQPTDRYILIRQYRAPCDAYVLEFPAGLVDPGESPASTALRELKEETGYVGRIRSVSPKVISSAGFSREGFHFVLIDVDEEHQENRNPQQECEHTEDIQVVIAGADELIGLAAESHDRGDALDSRVVAYFLGHGVPLWD